MVLVIILVLVVRVGRVVSLMILFIGIDGCVEMTIVERVGARSLLELLSFGIRNLGQVSERHGRTGELIRDSGWQLGMVWVNGIAFVINMREVYLVLVFSFSHHFLLLNSSLVLFTLRHLEEDVEKAKSAHHKYHEEIHDLEGEITLLFQIIPLISDGLNLVILNRICGNRRCLSTLSFGDHRFVFRLDVESKSIDINIFFSFVRLCAILKSFRFNCMSSLFVHLEFKNWTAFGVDIVALQINDLINGIEMNRDVFRHVLGVLGEVTPNLIHGVCRLELINHTDQLLLQCELISNFMICRLL